VGEPEQEQVPDPLVQVTHFEVGGEAVVCPRIAEQIVIVAAVEGDQSAPVISW